MAAQALGRATRADVHVGYVSPTPAVIQRDNCGASLMTLTSVSIVLSPES